VQAGQQGRGRQEGPQVMRRSRDERQREQRGEHAAEHGDEHGEDRGARRVMPWDAVGFAELHLRQDRPDRSGKVFSQLPHEHDPGPDPGGQGRPERGEQHPPHLHRREHGAQHADHGGARRHGPDAGQGGPHARPLAGHRIAAAGSRGRCEPPAGRPAADDPPDRCLHGGGPAATSGRRRRRGGRRITRHRGAIRHRVAWLSGFVIPRITTY
jgi:hypothetical protein